MSVRLDAVGDELTRSSSLPSNTAFTICGWSRIISDTGAVPQPLVWALDAGNTDGYSLLWDGGDNNMYLVAYDAAAAVSNVALGSRPGTGVDFFWYIACSGNGAGQQKGGWRAAGSSTYVTTTGQIASTIAAVTNIWFGGLFSTYYADKRVWNLKVWDRALTDAELDVESYFERVMFPANINAHWRLRNTTEVVDRSGNGRNLTTAGSLTTEDEYRLWTPSKRGVYALHAAGPGVGFAGPFTSRPSAQKPRRHRRPQSRGMTMETDVREWW